MEDLWKNITLSSLHNPSASSSAALLIHQTPHHHNHFQPNLTTTIFQDFLAQQFSHNDRTKSIAIVSASSQPRTILSLNSDHPPPDFHLNDSASGHSPPVFDNTCSSAARHCCTCKRRVVQQESESDEMKTQHPFDQRHKRMIKNRESAARSRARKQAYTAELELEVAQLKQENAILRKEQEMRNRADLDQSWPKKHKHHRASTAPF